MPGGTNGTNFSAEDVYATKSMSSIKGIMLEANLVEGNQKLEEAQK